MARAVWSGALSFGLVAMPVQLFTATESHTIRFHQLQRGTSDRVRNKRVNERTGEDVPMEEIVKGFDLGDAYVAVEPGELDEIAPGRSKGLEISGFVDLDEVEPVFFDRTYYLGPKGKEYAKVYSLLREALTRCRKAGIATVVMRNREYLVAVTAESEVLAVHTLHWADEVRDPRREIADLPERTQVGERELQTAVQLVEALSIDWDPREYHDTYQERVLRLMEAKRTGETLEKGEPPPRSTNVIDLMDALRSSVEQARGGQAGGPPEERGKASGDQPTRWEEGAGKRPGGRSTRKADGGRAKASGQGRTRKREPTARLEGLSKSDLYQRASEAGVPGRSSMSRDQLIAALSERSGRRRAAAS